MSVLVFVLVFLGLVAGLGAVAFFTYQHKLRRAKAIERGLKMVPILIHLPPPSADTSGQNRDVREVMREKTSQAEVLYNMIVGTATEGLRSSFYGQRHVAFELITINGVVHYFAAVPVALVSTVTKAIQTAYPGARLEEVEDHNIFNQEGRLAATLGGEMVLREESAYPIATYSQLERDPMEALLTTMTGLDKKDGAAVQIMIRPAGAEWAKRAAQLAHSKRQPGSNMSFSAMDVAKAAFKAPQQRREENRSVVGHSGSNEASQLDVSMAERIEEKVKRPGFEVLVRVIVSTSSVQRSQQLLRDVATAFALFDAPGSNGFKFLPALDVQGLVTAFIFRFFPPEIRSNVLNSAELATLFHFPDSQFTPSSSVERQMSKQVDGPVQLPSVGLLFGYNDFRGVKKEIRLSVEDRRRHTYILGQTGTGKSTMLENLAVQDMKAGNGFAFIDPHGDSAEKLLALVPKERAEDVVYFNPSDTEYPLGLNLFEFTDPQQKDFLVQETINMLYKLYDPGKTGIIGPRYEHWYRNAALTLMADPNGATFIEIPKVFTDTDYLKTKFRYLRDPTVIDFWTKEMGQTSDYHKSEMLGWFVSKFGAFQNNEMMRNILGQTKSAFNLRDIMDHRKLLIVNLSKGKVGELNSQLLGMIFVIKFQAAAMSRADMSEGERSDFSLYVDEFQNFSTESFATILSEARKYRLNLIVANQFIGQLSEQVREAVFGNIGTIVAHRMGPDDAEYMVKQFAPIFDTPDLVNLPNYNAAMRLMIGGLPSQPFTLRDLPPLGAPNLELGAAVRELSAAKFGRPKAEVEATILERFNPRPARAAAPAAPGAPGAAPAAVAPEAVAPPEAGIASGPPVAAPAPAVGPPVAAPAPAVGPPVQANAAAVAPAVVAAAPAAQPQGAEALRAAAAAAQAAVAPAPAMAADAQPWVYKSAAVEPRVQPTVTPAQVAVTPAQPAAVAAAASSTDPGQLLSESGFADMDASLGGLPQQQQYPPPAAPVYRQPIAAQYAQPAVGQYAMSPGQYGQSGSAPMLAQSPGPQAQTAPPPQGFVPASIGNNPPPIGAPPVDLPGSASVVPAPTGLPPLPVQIPATPMVAPPAPQYSSLPPAPAPMTPTSANPQSAFGAPPPIGPPPVDLSTGGGLPPAAPPAPTPAMPVPAPRPLGVDPQTLTVSDITGGRAVAPRGLDLASVPVMTPGTEPPPPAPMVMQPSLEPVEAMQVAGPEPEEMIPLGSGTALEGDPYAKIAVLGDLTPPAPPAPEDSGPAEGLPAQPDLAPQASGNPLPDDPYASIDVLGMEDPQGPVAAQTQVEEPVDEVGSPAEVQAAQEQVVDQVEPVPELAEEPVAVPPIPAPGPMPTAPGGLLRRGRKGRRVRGRDQGVPQRALPPQPQFVESPAPTAALQAAESLPAPAPPPLPVQSPAPEPLPPAPVQLPPLPISEPVRQPQQMVPQQQQQPVVNQGAVLPQSVATPVASESSELPEPVFAPLPPPPAPARPSAPSVTAAPQEIAPAPVPESGQTWQQQAPPLQTAAAALPTPHGMAEPAQAAEATADDSRLASTESLIHFVDPGAEQILQSGAVPEAVVTEPDEFGTELPEGVRFVQPDAVGQSVAAMPQSAQAVAAPPMAVPQSVPQIAMSAPSPTQPTPVPPTPAPTQGMATTPPPIGAPPMELPQSPVRSAPATETLAAPQPLVTPSPEPPAPQPSTAPPAPVPVTPAPVPAPVTPPAPVAVAVPAPEPPEPKISESPPPEPEPIPAVAVPAPVPQPNENLAQALEASAIPPSPLAASLEGVEAVGDDLAKRGVKPVEPPAGDQPAQSRVAEKPIAAPPAAEKSAPALTSQAEPKPSGQIEHAEHEIDELLSQSLIHPDNTATHRRLPEPTVPQAPAEAGLDMEMANARPVVAQPIPEDHAAEHHGLKVIQPLEPIVPAKEKFARELAAMSQPQGQPVQGKAPAQQAQEKHLFHLPFGKRTEQAPARAPLAGVQAPAEVKNAPAVAVAKPPLKPAPPASAPKAAVPVVSPKPAPVPVPQAPLPQLKAPAETPEIKKDERKMLPVSPPPVAIEDDSDLPKPESLAANDVAKARAERETAVVLKKFENAKVETPVKPEGPETQQRPPEKSRQPQPAKIVETGRHKRIKEEELERVRSAAEAEHNKPNEAEKAHGAMVGKLIVPTEEKPKPAPAPEKEDKPKKLAPGEVFVDAQGNVSIGE